jgi:hypothetical protein
MTTTNGKGAASPEPAAPSDRRVNHPTLGVVTDPREAYLIGFAEGMQHGFRTGIDRFLARMAELEETEQ